MWATASAEVRPAGSPAPGCRRGRLAALFAPLLAPWAGARRQRRHRPLPPAAPGLLRAARRALRWARARAAALEPLPERRPAHPRTRATPPSIRRAGWCSPCRPPAPSRSWSALMPGSPSRGPSTSPAGWAPRGSRGPGGSRLQRERRLALPDLRLHPLLQHGLVPLAPRRHVPAPPPPPGGSGSTPPSGPAAPSPSSS